jgi:hypothetical protein
MALMMLLTNYGLRSALQRLAKRAQLVRWELRETALTHKIQR